MTELERAKALAAKIHERAKDTLHRLEREMTIMQWPAEYRAIMWRAVAEEAMHRSLAAGQGESHDQTER